MKTGIALSGGAARGIAHIGILKALNELGVKPYVISGASAGAIIGAYYAAGHEPDEILKIASSIATPNEEDLRESSIHIWESGS